MKRHIVTLKAIGAVAGLLVFLAGAQAAAAPMNIVGGGDGLGGPDCDPFINYDDCVATVCEVCDEEYESTIGAYTCCFGGILYCENYCYWPF